VVAGPDVVVELPPPQAATTTIIAVRTAKTHNNARVFLRAIKVSPYSLAVLGCCSREP
jgi:hypothetical protein